MSSVVRWLVASALCATAVVGCSYLSGYYLRAWIGVDVALAWDTWLAYFRVIDLPAYAPYALAIRTTGAAAILTVLVVVAPALGLLFRKPKASLHGDARFATRMDLSRHGLLERRDRLAGVSHDPQADGLPTLGAIYRLSSGDGSDLKTYLRKLSSKPFLSDNARSAFSNLLSQAEETFSSILGSFREPLNAFLNPVLDAATSHNDFLLTDVRRKKMTIYIGIQPNKLAESRVLVNLFFSQLINVNTRTLPQSDNSLKHQCLMLMDEFTSIGRIDILAKSVSYMAGYNMRLLPIIQSMAQLDAVYGRDLARTLVTNHALQIIYAPREQQDANDYSDMLGYTTVRQTNVTRGRDVSRSESRERRALMLPQELKAIGFDKEVFLYEGIPHPVMCQKIKYYEDRMFKKRLLDRVEVKELEIAARKREAKRSVKVEISASSMKFLRAA